MAATGDADKLAGVMGGTQKPDDLTASGRHVGHKNEIGTYSGAGQGKRKPAGVSGGLW
jgi:hypothetical protein